MALKYSFKLIVLQFIIEFMINTALQASNSVNGREKLSLLIFRFYKFRGRSLVQWSGS